MPEERKFCRNLDKHWPQQIASCFHLPSFEVDPEAQPKSWKLLRSIEVLQGVQTIFVVLLTVVSVGLIWCLPLWLEEHLWRYLSIAGLF